ncbi:MAG: patatin-like phospholipase family protein [Anaerolineae bacterium]
MTKKIKILAIDGGGIRGIIPALVLAEIERRTQQPTSSLFDLIAGTSTGALLAMALVTPDKQGNLRYTAEDVANLYETHGSTIFSRSNWYSLTVLNNVARAKYPPEGLDTVLDYCFGDLNLSEAIGNVLITSYEIQSRKPWFFRSRKARIARTCDFKMRDVVRASTAAPTFFEPAQIFHPDEPNYFALVDGGLQANNPALCAYVEARDKNPDVEEFMVVSLGTGDHTRPIDFEESRRWGLAGWSQHIMDMVFDATSSTVDYQLRHLLPVCKDGIQHYYRLQTRLNGASDDLDDTAPENFIGLKTLAGQLIHENDSVLDDIVTQLLS